MKHNRPTKHRSKGLATSIFSVLNGISDIFVVIVLYLGCILSNNEHIHIQYDYCSELAITQNHIDFSTLITNASVHVLSCSCVWLMGIGMNSNWWTMARRYKCWFTFNEKATPPVIVDTVMVVNCN